MSSDINKRMVVGAGWLTGLRIFDRLVGLLSISVLARLLLPADFGLVAYAMTFYAILEAFFQFSFEQVLIRDQERSRKSYNTAWTLNIIKGAIVGALLVLGAQPIAVLFNEPRVAPILYSIAVVPIFRGIENIGIVDFQKDLTFHKEFFFQFSARIIAVIATITLAIVLRSYWALVIGMLITASVRLILSYVMAAYRPALNLSHFRSVFGFSKWLQLQNVLKALNERLPAVLIGRFSTAQALAYFTMSTELANFTSVELSAPIRRVLFPGLATLAHDRTQLVHTLMTSVSVIVLIALPATVGIGIVAPLLVPLFLGNTWVDLVPVLQVLAANAIVYVVLFSNSNVVYLIRNRPDITVYQSMLRSAVLLPIMFFLVPNRGAIGAAWALLVTNCITMVVDYALILRIMQLNVRTVVAAVWRSLAASVFMGVCVLPLQRTLASAGGFALALQLAICVGVGAISYCGAVFILWRLFGKPNDAEAYVISLLRRLTSRLIRSPQTSF